MFGSWIKFESPFSGISKIRICKKTGRMQIKPFNIYSGESGEWEGWRDATWEEFKKQYDIIMKHRQMELQRLKKIRNHDEQVKQDFEKEKGLEFLARIKR